MISLQPITQFGCELARQWRNRTPEALRTPFPLTTIQQEGFFNNLQNRNSPNRYWQVEDTEVVNPVGLVGLTNIEWENGNSEISLIVDPDARGKGIGSEAVSLILAEGFDNMRLHCIYGEVYFSNPNSPFWEKVANKYGGYKTFLPDRKYWDGRHWDSLYFSISEQNYRESVGLGVRGSGAGGCGGLDEPICPGA
jgi:RimJ/RimL family protein N-acetyltransferase